MAAAPCSIALILVRYRSLQSRPGPSSISFLPSSPIVRLATSHIVGFFESSRAPRRTHLLSEPVLISSRLVDAVEPRSSAFRVAGGTHLFCTIPTQSQHLNG